MSYEIMGWARESVREPEHATQLRITADELVTEHTRGRPAQLVGSGRRVLVVGALDVATLGPDPSRTTPLCATSAHEMPVVEVLSAVAAQHPSGVLVLERPQRAAAFAFCIERGRVTGASGCTQGGLPLPDIANTAPDAGRRIIDEHVLEHLQLTREPGARMTFIRGDVRWLDPVLPAELGSSLEHLLLEHARRWDEEPKLLRGLGDLEQTVVLRIEPGSRPHAAVENKSGGEDDWDFFDDPDPAAESEWQDAVALFAWCRPNRTLRQIIDTSPLGRFRCLTALDLLRREKNIELRPPAPKPEVQPQAAVIDFASERKPRTGDTSDEQCLPRKPVADTQYVYVRSNPPSERVRGPAPGTVGRLAKVSPTAATAVGSRPASASRSSSDRMQKMAQALQQRAALERANTPHQREEPEPAANSHTEEKPVEEKSGRRKKWLGLFVTLLGFGSALPWAG